MMRAMLFGDSHTVCVVQATEADPQKMDGIPIYRFQSKRSMPGDGTISIEEAVELIAELPPAAPIFLSLLGGYHNRIGMVRQAPDFDFLLDSGATLEDLEVRHIIPCRAVASAFDENIEEASKFLAIKQAARGPVFLIGTPPPKESNDFMLEEISKRKKQDFRGENIIKIGLNTPRLRHKFWALECERLKEWADRNGMVYLSAPKKAFSESLFLEECYYDDVTHANMNYGALVIEQISEIVGNRKEDAAHG